MAVYKGSYYINTLKGRFIYLLFEGTNPDEFSNLPINQEIQASCMNAAVNDGGTTTYYSTSVPINIKNSTAQLVTSTDYHGYADLVDGNASIKWSNNYGREHPYNGKFITNYIAVYKNTNTGVYYYNDIGIDSYYEDYAIGIAHPNPNTFGLVVLKATRNVTLGRINDTIPAALQSIFANGKVYIPSNDPYKDGGTSDKEGGTGDFDATSDPVDIPPLPTISATDTGFLTLFNPSLSNIRDLAAYMWANPLFDVNAYKKILANPMDAILGLSIVPCAIPATTSKNVTVGNIPTGVSMPVCDSQYLSINCGTINVNEFWGAYLDYSPYTKAELYLPYCGIHPIDIDDIMGKAVNVVYHVDILTGACAAYVKCGDSVLYSYIGQCASSIPVSGSDWTNMINGIINASTAIGSMAATGGLTAPMAASTIATTAVNTIKPSIERSGSLSGTGGIMGNQVPYLILTRPQQAMPELQNHFIGYPSFITSYLGDLSGYTEVESVHLEEIPATESELREIESLLKGGVLL